MTLFDYDEAATCRCRLMPLRNIKVAAETSQVSVTSAAGCIPL